MARGAPSVSAPLCATVLTSGSFSSKPPPLKLRLKLRLKEDLTVGFQEDLTAEVEGGLSLT